MDIIAINPHGFCGGVANAIEKAMRHLNGRAIYCLHELVHNEIVISDFEKRGVIFVESLDEVPFGATVVFSAHGVSPAVRAEAVKRDLQIIDTTCPFVARVHRAAKEFSARGLPVVVIGKSNHAEVKGILGEIEGDAYIYPDIPKDSEKIGVVSQTTMNADEVKCIVDELKTRFEVETMAEVCNATKERQDAVKAFFGDAMLVLGSKNSSNTKRLCEVAKCKSFRAGNMEEVKKMDYSGVKKLGVTSGASTPETLFEEAVLWLKKTFTALAVSFLAVMPFESVAQEKVPQAEFEIATSSTAEKLISDAPRFAYGYMPVRKFTDFLDGNEERKPFAGKSFLFIIVAVLIGGFCMNLTPCVLPMIPVNLMVIGSSFSRSLAYAAGIVVSYGTLGLLAAFGALSFGEVQSSPWFSLFLAIVFSVLALTGTGIVRIDFSRLRVLPRFEKGGIVFAFSMGALSALVAGSCVAPALIAVLFLTADMVSAGNILGYAVPFLFAVGMALPWPFLGCGCKVLPKPGIWMKKVNFVISLCIAALAAWYFVSAYQGFVSEEKKQNENSVSTNVITATPETFLDVIASVKGNVFIDCWATWCKNCTEMERTTLKNKDVASKLAQYTVIKLNATDFKSFQAIDLFKDVKGLPAFVVLNNVRKKDNRPKIAVYVGEGTKGKSLYSWMELGFRFENVVFLPVDATCISNVSIENNVRAIVFPDGSYETLSKSLGIDGVSKIKEFVQKGGGLVATGKSAALFCGPYAKKDGLLPFDAIFDSPRGSASISILFNKNAKAYIGTDSKKRELTYADGPMFVKCDDAASTNIVAVFNADISLAQEKRAPMLIDRPAVIAGSYGKGKVVLSSIIPEVDSLEGVALSMLKRVSGEKIKITWKKHLLGNYMVGIFCDAPIKIGDIEKLGEIFKEPKFDISLIDSSSIYSGRLLRQDAVVIPQDKKNFVSCDGISAETRAFIDEFVSAGDGVVQTLFGAGVSSPAKELKASLARPQKSVSLKPQKNKDAIKVAVYRDKGVSDDLETRLIDSCPEFVVTHVSGRDIASGALENTDMLVHAGGGGETQYKTLGTNGVKNVREFVKRGGCYHGTCAGAFLVIEPTRRKRIHMIPYKPDDPNHYRGGAELLLEITDDGMAALGPEKLRKSSYHGGPAMIKGSPVEGADFKTFAVYASHIVNTVGPFTDMLSMKNKAAMVAGTYGKGKMFICGPHPEGDYGAQDLYYKSLEWLIGRKVNPGTCWRRRALPNLAVSTGIRSVEGGKLFKELFWHEKFNRVRMGARADVAVLIEPKEKTYSSVPRGDSPVFVLASHNEAVVAAPQKLQTRVQIFKSSDELLKALNTYQKESEYKK
jgi:(E)-4-hydroxy-3-methyl-but-2-enyl pyrophosphate reductase